LKTYPAEKVEVISTLRGAKRKAADLRVDSRSIGITRHKDEPLPNGLYTIYSQFDRSGHAHHEITIVHNYYGGNQEYKIANQIRVGSLWNNGKPCLDLGVGIEIVNAALSRAEGMLRYPYTRTTEEINTLKSIIDFLQKQLDTLDVASFSSAQRVLVTSGVLQEFVTLAHRAYQNQYQQYGFDSMNSAEIQVQVSAPVEKSKGKYGTGLLDDEDEAQTVPVDLSVSSIEKGNNPIIRLANISPENISIQEELKQGQSNWVVRNFNGVTLHFKTLAEAKFFTDFLDGLKRHYKDIFGLDFLDNLQYRIDGDTNIEMTRENLNAYTCLYENLLAKQWGGIGLLREAERTFGQDNMTLLGVN
ncbi:hypothetical protein NO2_1123, partial [Candidatus Termititenax persephonae]